MTQALACRRCGKALNSPVTGSGEAPLTGLLDCPACRRAQWTWMGPALYAPARNRAGARAQDGDATCFFHASRRAERACQACGRYVCALCDMPLGQAHVCPSCLEEGRSPQVQAVKEKGRLRMDRLVLGLAIISVVPPFIFLSFLTAPFVLFQCLRQWNKQPGLMPVGKTGARLRLGVAFCIAAAQLGAWSWMLGKLILAMVA